MSTQDILARARARREELVRELAELDGFLRVYERLSGDRGVAAQAAPQAGQSGGESETARTRRQAREIIEKAGRPVPLGQLFREFGARGVTFPGKSPINTLGARLSGDKRDLVTLSGYGWWLAERPFPAANYPPEETPADEQGPSAGESANPRPTQP